jgi:hypothetical protein
MRSRSIALLVLLAVALCFVYANRLQTLAEAIVKWSYMPPPTLGPILDSPYILGSLVILLFYMIVALVLARSYASTRDAGFLWLGAAVIVWPFVSGWLQVGQQYLVNRVNHHPAVLFTFLRGHAEFTINDLLDVLNTLTVLRSVIGAGLMLVAVVYLGRSRSARSTDRVAI